VSILFNILDMKINKIIPDDNKFLQIATNIAKPPKSLYFLGRLPENRSPTVAIVGTRRPTAYGKEVGYRLAYDLAKQGVVVLSGLALGMDTIAHKAALDAGGITIAVLAGGLDSIHPPSNRDLAIKILQNGGTLISEYAPGETSFPGNFIARNRIVTGLSDGLLVVEASAKSGTMHTANFALEQGKPVMAVPGNITSPMSQGCNNLIRSGAKPIQEAKDVLDELGLIASDAQTKLPLAENANEHAILKLIAAGIRDGDEIQMKSGLSPSEYNQTLTMLEITGKIRPLGSNQWGS
jgi:DNA processing protein